MNGISDMPFPSMSSDDPNLDQIERVFAEYVERLNAGEKISPWEIERQHPEFAEELIEQLELFKSGVFAHDQPAPLGTLGDYTLRRQIGRGGMGIVYDAWQNSMDRRVALKVLPAGVAADTRACARFMREAQAAGKLSHQNVVAVHSTGVEEGTPWYAMEYVEGETLAQIVPRLKDAAPEADTPFGRKDDIAYFGNLARAFAGVAEGLQHAHSKGVIHRDIKPSNIVLDGDGRLRILDFGLARLEGQESLTISGDLLGTPLYMSPEQARQKKIQIDHRTDVYSVGATMYEMLAVRPPFKGKDHQDTLSQIIERDPVEPRKVNPHVPRDLETIVLKCMRKDPGDRYGTAEALAQDLRRFVRSDPIEARPQSSVRVLTRCFWRNRRRIAMALIAIASSLACVLVLAEAYREQRENRLTEFRTIVSRCAGEIRLAELVTEAPDLFRSGLEWVTDNDPKKLVWAARSQHLEQLTRQNLMRCRETVPELSNDVDYFLGRLCLVLGQESEAVKMLDRDFAPARILRSLILEENGDQQRAKEEERKALIGNSASWIRVWLRARRYSAAGRWREAAIAYDELLGAVDGNEPYLGFTMDIHLGRGYAHLQSGTFQKAVEEFSVAKRRWPEAIEPKILLARAWYMQGDEDYANELLRELEEQHPKADIGLWASTMYALLEDWQAASTWSKRIHQDPLTRALREAYCGYKLQLWDHVARASEEVLAQDPDHSEGYRYLGYSLVKLKEYDKAEQVYEESGKLPPETSPRLTGLARVASARGNYRKAVDYYKRAIEANEYHYHSYSNLGLLAYEPLGNFAAAERLYRYLIRRFERVSEAYLNLCILLRQRGDFELALKLGRRAEELDRWHWGAPVLQAICLWGLGKREAALDLARRTTVEEPERAMEFAEYGRMLLQRGQTTSALDALKKAVALDEEYATAWYHFGEIYAKDSLAEKAIEHYGRALKENPGFAAPYSRIVKLVREPENHGIVSDLDDLLRFLEKKLAASEPNPSPVALKGLAALWRAHPTQSDPDKAREYEALALEACRGQGFKVLEEFAEMQFASGERGAAVRTLEMAGAIPGASVQVRRKLMEYRKAAGPDLPSFESIDAALEALDTVVLINHGANWRFFRGTQNPAPSVEWASVDFKGSHWETGKSGFGYGPDHHATALNDMRGLYNTVYIRHEFAIDDPARYKELRLSAYVDDGFAVFLNGLPVSVWKAPPDVASHSHGTLSRGGVPEYYRYAHTRDSTIIPGLLPCGANIAAVLDVKLLRPGKNVLAIQGFNIGLNDRDFSLIPVLEAKRFPDSGADSELLEELRAGAKGKDIDERLAYLEGRLLQRREKHADAVAKFRELSNGKPEGFLPAQRLAKSLRSMGQSREARVFLEQSLRTRAELHMPLLSLWTDILLSDQSLTADEIVESLSEIGRDVREPGGEDSALFLEDVQWSLASLVENRAIRLNCSGGEYRSTDNRIFSADRFFQGGYSFWVGKGKQAFRGNIGDTEDHELYWTGRWFPPGEEIPAYRIPLPAGRYHITLHFAENWIRKPGQQVFDVLINSRPVRKNFEPGLRVASRVEISPVHFDGGFLEIGFRRIVGNPAVSAIEIEQE